MIKLEELDDQQWYDGFIWDNKGTQKGVTTLKWSSNLVLFCDAETDPEYSYAHVDDGRYPANTWRFEPNVKSEVV